MIANSAPTSRQWEECLSSIHISVTMIHSLDKHSSTGKHTLSVAVVINE